MSSAATQVAVLGTRAQMASGRSEEMGAERPRAVRLIAFGALGLYGTVRWSKLLAGGAHGRLLGILALAFLLAGARPALARRHRLIAAAFTAIVLLAALPIAGLPLPWVLHLRIAVIANAIGDGLTSLPQVLVPYTGADQWIRLDIVLGGAVLMFDAALLLAFSPRRMDDLRRAGAALPLVALIAVPSTLAHPRFPYLNGLALFLMLAAFGLGDRINGRQAASALGLCLITAIAAMLIAPALDRRTPWLNYEALAGSLSPKAVEVFDWSQNYGPVNWPQRGHTVLEVTASHPEYWKAEDLDVFDDQAWTQGEVPGQQNAPPPSSSALASWTQTIHVTVRDMRTSDVIGAGTSSHPADVSQQVLAGFSPGTWTAGAELRSGERYTVRVYTPHPTAAQLNRAGADYRGLPAGYRTVLLPVGATPGAGAPPEVVFPGFRSRAAVQNLVGLPVSLGTAIVRASVYGPAYRLAGRLAASAPTPYAYVLAVERFLAHGFSYTQDPPVRRYPLESFLFTDKRGYCQQFAGAMALLLRMGGVPARVAVGFTQGSLDPRSGSWLVADFDAHAWVEAWFPGYGWVTFDPTPPVDPALSRLAPVSGGGFAASSGGPVQNNRHVKQLASSRASAAGTRHRRSGSGGGTWEAVAGAAAALLGVLGLAWLASRPLGSVEELVSELERALARTGRPPAAGDTLVTIERQLRPSPASPAASAAGEYIRSLSLARFAGAEKPPTLAGRRALRRALALRSGPLGKLRALWALPPRRRSRRWGRGPHTGVLPGA